MSGLFNRGTGLLVIEACGSNPNGDPDAEGEPRTTGADGRGLISPVSFKRKLRDLVGEDGPVREAAWAALGLGGSANKFGILESRGRKREEISQLKRDAFVAAYWDARVFGNTFLESMKGADKDKKDNREHFIRTGAVQFGPGISIAPIDIKYGTWSNKAGVEGDKDRGLAPLAWRFVPHAVYAMPFFVNPLVASKSGCTASDIDLMKFVIPLAYSATASVARPNVNILHAWYAEHASPLGSCPDWRIIDAMTPTKPADGGKPSQSRAEYGIPGEASLPQELRSRLRSFEDLTVRDWRAPAGAGAALA